MKQAFILFSHKLTSIQEKEIKENLFCEKINYLPKELQHYWSNVDKNVESEKLFINYLNEFASKGDYILVQGEWGLTYKMIRFCKKNEFIPIYSYSKRNVEEKIEGENIKKISFFKHVKFMEY